MYRRGGYLKCHYGEEKHLLLERERACLRWALIALFFRKGERLLIVGLLLRAKLIAFHLHYIMYPKIIPHTGLRKRAACGPQNRLDVLENRQFFPYRYSKPGPSSP